MWQKQHSSAALVGLWFFCHSYLAQPSSFGSCNAFFYQLEFSVKVLFFILARTKSKNFGQHFA
jgi:hypothetical protein